MNKPKAKEGSDIPALLVHQWQPEWGQINFEEPLRSEPPKEFYLFSIKASVLRALCGIERREAKKGARRKGDLGIQRRHEQERSEEIARFIRHGFPWAALGKKRRESGDFDDLKQPGWLPTAIVVNIRTEQDEIAGTTVDSNDLIEVGAPEEGIARLQLPISHSTSEWTPKGLYPVEVIDGQHRLWAFDPEEDPVDFEFPVVAFVGLARSWQAYLFWTINIKPKRINASLAFDLYPLLRHQEWLERFEGPAVYRETRAQELTELMWAHEKSPWHNRINMLGERGNPHVSQAAWVRALTNTFVRSYGGGRVKIGGLFGAPVGSDEEVLDWTREQQAAFLIYAWQQVETAVNASSGAWASALRNLDKREIEEKNEPKSVIEAVRRRAPFASRWSLLNTDQGVRGILHLVNDLSYLAADDLSLEDWRAPDASEISDREIVTEELKSLKKRPVAQLLDQIGSAVGDFDWRTSATPGLGPDDRRRASAFRGSSGYRELRLQLLEHVAAADCNLASPLASQAFAKLSR